MKNQYAAASLDEMRAVIIRRDQDVLDNPEAHSVRCDAIGDEIFSRWEKSLIDSPEYHLLENEYRTANRHSWYWLGYAHGKGSVS